MFDRLRARMFNRSASNPSKQPDRVLAVLGLRTGNKVADLGSGGGYYALRFARETGPEGKVYAVDINPAFLGFIRDGARAVRYENVDTVLVPEIASRIPAGSLDLLFCRDVYHHLTGRTSLFKDLARYLKPAGRVAIIDWLPGASRYFGPPPGHRTAPETIIAEMEAAGFFVLENLDFLKGQSYTLFGRKKQQ
jgi:arsenite methyltransferase